MRSIIYADLQHIVFLCINRKMHNAVYFDTAYSNAYTAVYCNHIFLNCTIDHIALPYFSIQCKRSDVRRVVAATTTHTSSSKYLL